MDVGTDALKHVGLSGLRSAHQRLFHEKVGNLPALDGLTEGAQLPTREG
jgi:hypothetical protein